MINILVVDDHLNNVNMLTSALKRDDIVCYGTTLPKKGWQMCIDHSIDIALIDVNMPELSGFELLQAIKNNPLTRRVMVILITGYSMDTNDVVKGLTLGAVDYLFKPLDLHVTIAKVDSITKLILQQREINNKNHQLEQYKKELLEMVSIAEKSKLAKENFLANMSHEIRTPLNAILGLIHIFEATKLDAEQSKLLRMLTYSSKLLLQLVNDILDISKIDAGKVKINKVETDLSRLVNDICELTRPLAESKNLALSFTVDKNIPDVVMADTLRLNQILINLINNAIKFTEYGGVNVKVTISEVRESQILLSFSISDTGIGIPSELIGQIFNRYERLESPMADKFGSTGLGLPIVKKLVELKGGTLNVESSVGVGTTFTFTNWYKVNSETEVSKVPETKERARKSFRNISLLLADDDEINRFVTTQILSEWNIQVDEAENGLDAYVKAKSKQYDVILMDINMPVMNGIETTRKIRNELSEYNRHIPIIAFSAFIKEEDRLAGKDVGIDAYILKPIEPESLYSQLQELLNRNHL
ncbi:response regulator [Pedobacter terrae]|uniref:response regulator n=1 Tax=Pedobacter terrae TaxID=405671 RepID=UPI002FF97B2E